MFADQGGWQVVTHSCICQFQSDQIAAPAYLLGLGKEPVQNDCGSIFAAQIDGAAIFAEQTPARVICRANQMSLFVWACLFSLVLLQPNVIPPLSCS